MKKQNADITTFEKLLKDVENASLSGWDFSCVSKYGGNPEDPLPWSYTVHVMSSMKDVEYMLDMGTGGGEFLSSLCPLPKCTFATEAYKPNVRVAKEKLKPLGIKVVQVEDGRQEGSPLPFEEETFDLVVNRHECYEVAEVYRILKPGGYFITEQVGNKNNENLRLVFGSPESENEFIWNLETARHHLKRAGFKIHKAKEYIGYNRFYDIRALVYLLKVLPWEFPGFTVQKYKDQLYDIYLKITDKGYYDSVNYRFFMIAFKT